MGQRVVFPAVYHYQEPPSFSSTCSSCYWKPLFFLPSRVPASPFSLIGIMFLAGVAYIVPGIKVILGS